MDSVNTVVKATFNREGLSQKNKTLSDSYENNQPNITKYIYIIFFSSKKTKVIKNFYFCFEFCNIFFIFYFIFFKLIFFSSSNLFIRFFLILYFCIYFSYILRISFLCLYCISVHIFSCLCYIFFFPLIFCILPCTLLFGHLQVLSALRCVVCVFYLQLFIFSLFTHPRSFLTSQFLFAYHVCVAVDSPTLVFSFPFHSCLSFWFWFSLHIVLP